MTPNKNKNKLFWAIINKFLACCHPTDSLKMPPTQNILWPLKRYNFFILILDIFFVFNVFLRISEKKEIPTHLENYE